MEGFTVVIVGAGPAGLATAACLNHYKISNVVLEREDCNASLWTKRAYDRLSLHLGKEFCELPHMPYAPGTPTFIPRQEFISYLTDYASALKINIRHCRSVESAYFDENVSEWHVVAKNSDLDVIEEYASKFLVVATGENSEGIIPHVDGLDSFTGEYIHSNTYQNGNRFIGKTVLVVGCGNSGMEIAYDLSNYGVKTSIVTRNPVHILTKRIVYIGMKLLQYNLPCNLVDKIVVFLGKMRFGNLSKHGIKIPNEGPFYIKATTGRSATIDVGAIDKIKGGDIQVFPTIKTINGNQILFENNEIGTFDAIIFATGYKSTVKNWLKGGEDLFGENGMPKQRYPKHWEGKNGVYSAGFAQRGLAGIAEDAKNIAKEISLRI